MDTSIRPDARSQFRGQTVLVVGGTRRLGAAIASAAAGSGADVRTSSHREGEGVFHLDLRDESTVASVAAALGPVDHVVTTASMNYSAAIVDMDAERVKETVAAKVIGPLLLAKHLQIERSLTIFSGQVAWRPAPRSFTTGIVNGATSFAAQHLAVELAPVRVNAISPGIVDSGAWDGQGDGKAEFLTNAASRTLTGTIGTVADVVDAVLWMMSASFLTGQTIRLDGGRR